MKNSILISSLLIILFSSCTKDNDPVPGELKEFTVNSTSSTTWKYFSFELNDTLQVSDPANSTEWDLAFQRYRIKTNSGVSGSGSGSAARSYKKMQDGFDLCKFIPDTTTFVADQAVQIAVQQGYATYNINPVLYTWFTMEFGPNGTQIVPTDDIYYVKTASGKYAKIWFKSYYSATNASGYVTFQYKYQADGSRNVE